MATSCPQLFHDHEDQVFHEHEDWGMGEKTFSIAIIGGGLAGLSAAAALAGRGFRVEVFESRPRLGGRAGAFFEPTMGQWIDFGQHVLLGCCHHILHFCRQTGLHRFLHRDTRLYFLGPEGRPYPFQATPILPAPLHLLPSLFRLGYLSWFDRLKVAGALARLARQRCVPENLTLADWLSEQGQPPAAMERFWTPVILSALADLPERVALSVARKVFVEGFLTNRTGYHLFRPTLPWGRLLDQHLANWLGAQGVLVHRRTPIRQIEGDRHQADGLLLADGTRKTFDFYILAVPWRQSVALVPPAMLQAMPELAQAVHLEPGAITTWHLWFDRPITGLPHAAVVGKAIQWLFAASEQDASCNLPLAGEEDTPVRGSESGSEAQAQVERRPKVSDPANPAEHSSEGSLERQRPSGYYSGYYYQVVLSGTHLLREQTNPQSVEELLRELAEIFPTVQGAKLLASRRVKMAEAVFCPRPGIEALRPGQRTPMSNIALAGDWTATGWPATLESAVRSGYLAAEVALEWAGIPERLLAWETAPGLLARWVVRTCPTSVPG